LNAVDYIEDYFAFIGIDSDVLQSAIGLISAPDAQG
jgi:hypothetical protein